MKQLGKSLKVFFFMTLLTGVVYPVLMTGVARTFFPGNSSGRLINHQGTLIGSELIAQKFEGTRYFWPRPSAVDFNPMNSGGSNLGPTSGELLKAVTSRKEKLKAANPSATSLPQDMLFASGSGLDPHISPQAAIFQIKRIAKVRKISEQTLFDLVHSFTHPRQWGIFGEPRVNVLMLNLALDHLSH
jgi:K+-transporting ATPase ATPase C chain